MYTKAVLIFQRGSSLQARADHIAIVVKINLDP
jgi:hypothetical protein